MSTYNDKTLKNVADAVMNVMREELKGNQHKIDKNKNNKIDAQDFKILRGEKKPPFEGGKEKPETVTDKSGAQHTPMSRAKDLARRNMNKEETEQVDEASSPVWDYKNSATEKKTGATTRTGHDVRKTNTGTVYTKRAPMEKDEKQAPTVSKKSTSNLMSDEEFKKKHGMSRKNYERMQSGVKIGESFSEILESYRENGLAITSIISEVREYIEEEPTQDEYNAELETAKEKSQGRGKKAEVSKGAVQAVQQEEHKCDHPKSERCDKCPDTEMKEDFDLSDFSLEELEEFMQTEEYEQLDEISKQTLGSYIKKASHDVAAKGAATRQFVNDARQAEKEHNYTERRKKNAMADKVFKKSWKRREGMAKAVDRLTKEEAEQLDELSKKTLGSYVKAAAKDAEDAGRAQEYYGHKNDYKRGEKRQKGVERAINRLAKEEAEQIDEISTAQMSHQGKTTLKHIKNPGVELRMAAHDVKPGVSGYRDRIDLLKAAKAQGKLKEENDEESEVEKNKEQTKKTFPNVKHFTKSGHPDWKKHGYKDMPVKEEVEQIDELSKKTLGSYAKKATDDVSYHSYAQGHGRTTDAKYHDQKAMKRQAGVNKAIDRLTKEDLEEEFEGTLEEAAKKLDIWANARSPRPSGVVVHHSHPDNPKKIIKTHLNNKTALKDLDANIKASKSKVHKIALKWGRHVDLDNAPHMTRLRDYSSYLKKEEVEQIDEMDSQGYKGYRGDEDSGKGPEKIVKPITAKKAIADASKLLNKQIKKTVKEEVELDERTLSKPEMEKREDYVKGMKKKLSGFKSRYGERAKEVMYATATRMAKGDKE